jgi:hypothetical protein
MTKAAYDKISGGLNEALEEARSQPLMIPDDIRKAAEKLRSDIDGCECDHCVETVERALMTERERCAKIAENDDAFPQEGAAIPDDIRKTAEVAFMSAAFLSSRWQQFEVIARALMNERERASQIVERWSLPTIQTPSMWLIDKAGIAAAIRRGDNPDA